MAIDISKIKTGLTQQPAKNNAVEQAQSSTKGQKVESTDDSVKLTPEAKQLMSTNINASNTSTVDEKKVAELKQLIQEGKYVVDAPKLANNITLFEKMFSK